MASNDEMGQISLDLCSCVICNRPARFPKCLPCMHTCCKSCLNEHIRHELEVNQNGKKTFQCPNCGVITELPSELCEPYSEFFSDDSFVNKLSEVISAYSIDKRCDICERGDITSEAVEWCFDCYDSMCEKCGTVHLHGKVTSHHLVVPLDDLRSLNLESILKLKRTVPCLQHQGELLQIYCSACRIPVCTQCVSTSHRSCKQLVCITDAVEFHKEELNDVLEHLNEAKPQETKTADTMNILEESIANSAEQIKSTASELRAMIDKSENELLLKLETVSAEMRSKMANKIPIKDLVTLIKTGSERMEYVIKYGNEVEILEAFDGIKNNISEINSDSADDDVMAKVNFVADTTTKIFKREFKSLGEVDIEDCSIDHGLSSFGVTCTSRDEIIVVDCRNKRVKKFSIEGNLIDHIQISEEPRDLTCTGRNEVAVTIMNKFIFFLSTANAMRLRRKVKTEKQYDGISMANLLDRLLVSCMEDKSIDVIDIEGEILQSFNVNGDGIPIFQEPRYVAFSKQGTYVVSDVAQGCITGIAADGHLLFQYQPEGSHVLRHPQGVCIDNIGNVFIVDYSKSRIHLITNEGHFQRFILGDDSGLVRPVAIHITPTNKLIIVQSDGMIKLFSYE